MEYTKGEWKNKHGLIASKEKDIAVMYVSKTGCATLPTEVEALANAHLIVTAVNGCVSVNPDNPMAVAESIKDLYEALKYLSNTVAQYSQYTVDNSESYRMALAALSKAEGR